MKVVYILAGVCVANVVADIIAIKKTKNTEKRLNNKINDLAGVVKSMKKERIDDWFDSASDILTSHQESIDDLELKVNPAFFICNEQKAINTIHDFADRIERLENDLDKLEDAYKSRLAFEQDIEGDIYRLEGEIAEIKEILEKTAGVKFTSDEEVIKRWQRERSVLQSYKRDLPEDNGDKIEEESSNEGNN